MGDSVKALTIIWDLLTFLAAFVFLWLAHDSMENKKALKSRGMNGSARHACNMDFRLDVLIALALFFLFFMGLVISITTFRGDPPFNPLQTWALRWVSLVFRVSLIASVVVLLSAGIKRKFDRRKLIEILSSEHDVHTTALTESRNAGYEEGSHESSR